MKLNVLFLLFGFSGFLLEDMKKNEAGISQTSTVLPLFFHCQHRENIFKIWSRIRQVGRAKQIEINSINRPD